MLLDDYFDFLAPDDIRLRGSRIGIETVLYDFIHRARTPDEIQADYPGLSLEQVYATVLYYLHNRDAVHAYLTEWLEYCFQSECNYDANPPGVVQRLRALRVEREPDAVDPRRTEAVA